MAETKIEWADYTFNPWEGCTKVSPACDNCYAEARDKRMHGAANWGKDANRLGHSESYWKQPLKWNRQAERRMRVFCGSLCDVMEDRADLSQHRDRLYELIEETPNLDWLLLTKRPQNFRRFLPKRWLDIPRSNVWGMTTVEDSDRLWRIDVLRQTPFSVRGLSIEPLLEDIPYIEEFLAGIDWVIVGGESGPKARPMHADWVRRIRDVCVSRGIAFHFKQWGWWFAGKSHGRTLDGRTWDELPQVNVMQEAR